MMKVSKELLATVKSGKITLPKGAALSPTSNLVDLTVLAELIRAWSALAFTQLATTLARKVGAEKRPMFDVWQGEESESIQRVARAFGERLCVDEALVQIGRAQGATKVVLERILRLHALSLVERELGWMVAQGLVPPAAAEKVEGAVNAAVADIAPDAIALVDAFAIPEDMLYAPIAIDWERYNEYDNHGELVTAKL